MFLYQLYHDQVFNCAFLSVYDIYRQYLFSSDSFAKVLRLQEDS